VSPATACTNGHPDEAIPVLEKAAALSDRSPAIIGVLVRAYAHAGRPAEALRLLGELSSVSITAMFLPRRL